MKKLLTCVLAVALVVGTAATASAMVKKVGGHISLNTANSTAFKGKVKSSRKFCYRNRLVVLKRKKPGKDPTIGRDRTNSEGRYRIELANPVTGNFYSRATRKIKIVSGHGIVCRPIESSVIHISP